MKELVAKIPQRAICSVIWLLPILTVIGARFNLPGLLLANNFLIVIIVLGVGFGVVKRKYIPLSLVFIALSLLWQTSIQTNNLVGTDIQTEYYYYKLAENGWDAGLRHNYNSCIGITLIAPFLHKVFMIDGMWTFKFLFPALFALTPMVLYYVYRTFLKEKLAFLAAFFFVCFPSFTLEAVSMTKLQLSGLMFGLLILIAVKKNWSWKLRLPLGTAVGILCAMFYYSFGYILFMYLVGCIVVLAIMRFWPWIRGKTTLALKGLLIASVLIIGVSCVYYDNVAQGDPLRTLTFYVSQNILAINITQTRYAEEMRLKRAEAKGELNAYYKDKLAEMQNEPAWTDVGLATIESLPGNTPTSDVKNYLVKAGLGLDFFKVDLVGKLFRILQLLTEALIVVGCIVAFLKRRRIIPSVVIALAASGLIAIGLIIFKPGFSGLLNITRVYLIMLCSLAPLAILGGYLLLKKVTKKFTISLLYLFMVAYFLFTSGMVFELTKRPDVSTQSIPYSIGLSSYRIDIFGLFTDNDARVSAWVEDNLPMDTYCFSDLPGMELMYQWTHSRVFNFPQNWLPQSLTLIPDKSWIFLREWSQENKMVTSWTNTGLRTSISYEDRGVTELLKGRKIIFQAGDAVVYGPKTETTP